MMPYVENLAYLLSSKSAIYFLFFLLSQPQPHSQSVCAHVQAMSLPQVWVPKGKDSS